MKKILPFLSLTILICSPALSAETQTSKYFDSLAVVSARDIVLSDTIEFASLNVETLEVINEAPEIEALVRLPVIQPDPAPTSKTMQKTKKETLSLPPHAADAPAFQEINRSFYLNLKKHIVEQQVPLTLVATQLPSYAKPLTLLIKINKVQFKAYQPDSKGYTFLPVVMDVSGEIKDKLTNELLFTFADSVETSLPTDNAQPQDVLNQAAFLLMKDLALFLKSRF